MPLNRIREHFGWALWFYHRFAYDAPFFGTVQVVIPDRAGFMPGESGYSSSTRQPVLSEPFRRVPVERESDAAGPAPSSC